VEEEEAMALAQVQSLMEEDQPHPPISLAPPTETVVVHVQPDNVSYSYNSHWDTKIRAFVISLSVAEYNFSCT